ncbi:unnamed protein product [Blepharisma stoltei]|uniref:Uncharacterized protein n=1 Tax=Blepharisma stoltei TaxID=1481888 RepID=A0AAU9IF49_9CILI|nr:unnamed protein product [Blepharisma stoltei]
MGCCAERPSVEKTIENKDTFKARINKQFNKQKKTEKYEFKGESKEDLLISIAVNHKILNNKLKQSKGKESKPQGLSMSRRCTRSSVSTN